VVAENVHLEVEPSTPPSCEVKAIVLGNGDDDTKMRQPGEEASGSKRPVTSSGFEGSKLTAKRPYEGPQGEHEDADDAGRSPRSLSTKGSLSIEEDKGHGFKDKEEDKSCSRQAVSATDEPSSNEQSSAIADQQIASCSLLSGAATSSVSVPSSSRIPAWGAAMLHQSACLMGAFSLVTGDEHLAPPALSSGSPIKRVPQEASGLPNVGLQKSYGPINPNWVLEFGQKRKW
jgi:hypothetical protein